MNRLLHCAAALALVAAAAGPFRLGADPVVDPLTDTSIYPIAVWAMPSSEAAPLSELGVNIFVAGEENPRGWCDTLAASGCVGFVHWSSRRTPGQRAEIAASPGFLGWMHGDEPDNPAVVDDVFRITRIPPSRLQSAYDEMRASSTPAPMYLNLGQGLANGINQSTPDSLYPAFCSTADIVCYDVYPTSTQENGLDRLHLVARGVERLRRFAGPDKPLWIWLECTAIHDGDAGIGNRAPLPHEVRAEVWMSVVHGADGIGWFPHQFKPYRGGTRAIPEEVQTEIGLTNGLLHQLAPVLRRGARELISVDDSQGWVRAAHWKLQDEDLLVVVNMRNEWADCAVRLPPTLGALRPLGGAAGSTFGSQTGGGPCPCRDDDAQVRSRPVRPRRDRLDGGSLELYLRPYEVAIFTSGMDQPAIDYTYPEPDPPPLRPNPVIARAIAELPELPANRGGVAWSRTPSSRITVPNLPTSPLVDGDLTDPAWAYAAPLAPLTNTAGTGLPTAATGGRLGRHGETLFLAFRAEEPRLDSLVTHYAAGWRNDCVELWFDPDNRRTSFAHLIATSDGRIEVARTVQDAWGEGERDEGWDPRVALRTGREDGAWTAELAIEIEDLGHAAPGAVWGFDVARERKPGGGENSVWTLGRFNGAAYFGELAFPQTPPNASDAMVADLVLPELILAGGALHNHTGQPVAAQVDVLVSRRREASRYSDWNDQWVDLALETVTVEVPARRDGVPGRTGLLAGDAALRVPAGGRLKLSLRAPGVEQFEEFIANPLTDGGERD